MLALVSLRFIRDTAFNFRAADRRAHAFTVYQAARDPATLAAVKASLPPGTVLTARHVREFRKGGPRAKPPRTVAALAERLAAILLKRSHAARCAAVGGLMDALGLCAEDFSSAPAPSFPPVLLIAAPIRPAVPAAAVAA